MLVLKAELICRVFFMKFIEKRLLTALIQLVFSSYKLMVDRDRQWVNRESSCSESPWNSSRHSYKLKYTCSKMHLKCIISLYTLKFFNL